MTVRFRPAAIGPINRRPQPRPLFPRCGSCSLLARLRKEVTPQEVLISDESARANSTDPRQAFCHFIAMNANEWFGVTRSVTSCPTPIEMKRLSSFGDNWVRSFREAEHSSLLQIMPSDRRF